MNDGFADTSVAPAGRRRRTPHFLRPKPPHDWRWVVGGIGKALIVLGLMMFAFVGYQLWGTGLQTARAQHDLENEFEKALQNTTTVATTTPSTTSTATPSSTAPSATTSTTSTVPTAPSTPPIEGGEWIGRLVIPSIDLDWIVVEGVQVADLKKGPGHFRETPMPGQLGNSAIAGHRTTYGAPFYDLDELEPGDLIEVQTLVGTYTYEVTGSEVVSPADYALVIPTTDPTVATLTLATCTPAYTARERLIVYSVLVPEQSDQVYAPPSNTVPPETGPPETVPAESVPVWTLPGEDIPGETIPQTTDSEPIEEDVGAIDDTFDQGWFDDGAAVPHVVGWGALLVAVWVGSWFAGRAAKRLYVCFLVGAIPFLIVLYFFFENVNRLLPANL